MKFENKNFVHLHNHSDCSNLDGLAPIKKMVLKAREMGFPALALTDHGNVGGLIKLIKECRSTKDKDGNSIPYPTIKPILGCEFYCSANRLWKSKIEQIDGQKGNRHLNLFAKNFIGYQNLCYLSEKSWTEGFYYDPRIDIDLISKHSEGLMCSSACLGSLINANLLYDRYDVAKQVCGVFKDIFKDDFFLEVMYHGISEEKLIIGDIIKLGKEMDIPLITTNDLHYLTKDQGSSHEVFMCMSTSSCITNPKHLKFDYNEFYMKSAEEMGLIFSGIPEAMFNTVEFASRIDDLDISKKLFGGMRLPKFDIPQEFKTNTNEFESKFNYLKHLVDTGMKKRGWNTSQKHIERLELEMNDLRVAWENNGYDFVTYFLIEADIMKFANDFGILTGAGRGSGYASVALHCLDICYGIDPIDDAFSLIWERFLGFSEKKFIKASDFGIEEEFDVSKVVDDREDNIEEEDLNDDLDSIEDDISGASRY